MWKIYSHADNKKSAIVIWSDGKPSKETTVIDQFFTVEDREKANFVHDPDDFSSMKKYLGGELRKATIECSELNIRDYGKEIPDENS